MGMIRKALEATRLPRYEFSQADQPCRKCKTLHSRAFVRGDCNIDWDYLSPQSLETIPAGLEDVASIEEAVDLLVDAIEAEGRWTIRRYLQDRLEELAQTEASQICRGEYDPADRDRLDMCERLGAYIMFDPRQ